MPTWFGRRLARALLRLVSMEENKPAELSQVVTPTSGYFRRDRHVHPAVDPETYRLPLLVTVLSYAFATLVTLIASLLSALVVRRKLDSLDLIAVLKTRE